jgi:hypothetical protein
MSDTTNPPRLELLGEMIRRLQADLRTVRDEGKLARSQTSREIASLRESVVDSLHTQTERIAAHEAYTSSRLDQMSEVLFAIADKLGVEYRR